MCHAFLSDPNFYDLLFRLDEDLAGEVRGAGCSDTGRDSIVVPKAMWFSV